MRAISLALLAGGALGARLAVHEDLQRNEDLERDSTYPGQAPGQVDTLADVPLPRPLTADEREKDRTSLRFVRHMLQMAGADMTELFCSRSEDDCGTVDEYPGYNTHSELRFDEIVTELAKTPEREVRGEIRRLGDLGYLIFNDLLWHNDWKAFPIGADIEDHRKSRPIGDLLMGHDSPAWSRRMIRQWAEEFFEGRESFNSRDLIRWNNKLLHKILMNLDLTDEEESKFETYKGGSTTASTLPRWLVSSLRWVFSLNDLREKREELLTQYQEAFDNDSRGIIPHIEGRDKRFLADMLLTALTSAGGLSVPTVMWIAFGVLHGAKAYGEVVMPDWQNFELTNRNIEQVVLECVRRFPVVVGFPWWDPENTEFRTVLAVAMAMRDPRAWEAPREFRLRPLREYHETRGMGSKIGVAWAQQGIGMNGLTPDSRGCPGQELSVVIVSEILRAYMHTQNEWSVVEAGDDGIQITEGPSAASSFTLVRNGHAADHIPTEALTTPAPESDDEADAENMGSWWR